MYVPQDSFCRHSGSEVEDLLHVSAPKMSFLELFVRWNCLCFYQASDEHSGPISLLLVYN